MSQPAVHVSGLHGLSMIDGSCHQPHRTGDRRQVLPDPAATVLTTVHGQRTSWSETTGYGGMVLKPIRVHAATSSTRFNHPGGYPTEANTRGRANHRHHPPAPHRKGRGYPAEAATRVPGTDTGRSHRKRSDRLEAVRTARTILRPSWTARAEFKAVKSLVAAHRSSCHRSSCSGPSKAMHLFRLPSSVSILGGGFFMPSVAVMLSNVE